MPTAFVALPYEEPYESLFKRVIRPELTAAGFDVVRADEIPRSSDVLEDTRDRIATSDLLIIEATSANPNVYFEFGMAAAANKEFILLAQTSAVLPFDTKRWRHLRYDAEHLDTANAPFKQWLHNTAAYRKHHQRTESPSLERGDVLPGIFDSSSFIPQTDASIEDLVLGDINSGSMISCEYIYNTDQGALRWLALCEDPSYKLFQESLRFLESKAQETLEAMGAGFLSTAPDYVSLGPGNGQKDRILLKALLRYLDDHSIPPDFFYYPVDISERMIGKAIKTITADRALKNRFRIKGVHADFAKLSLFRPVVDYRPEPNIFLLLGNTLGNIQNEVSFLEKIRTAMHEDDILVLEVRLRTGDHFEPGGNLEDNQGLSFAPLAAIGVPFEEQLLEYRPEEAASQIPKTMTIAGYYRRAIIRGRTYKEIFLNCVNHYDRDELRRQLVGPRLHFEILRVLDNGKLGLFIARKRPTGRVAAGTGVGTPTSAGE
jgi:hypothetical protein